LKYVFTAIANKKYSPGEQVVPWYGVEVQQMCAFQGGYPLVEFELAYLHHHRTMRSPPPVQVCFLWLGEWFRILFTR
jgi:hypothetical protein